VEVIGLKDLPSPLPECVEDEPTFEGNARKKARHYAALSGLLTLADDSGLCVAALDGAPGVFSARYAGVSGAGADAANNAKLLAALAVVPDERRQAKFVCAMALAEPVRSSRFSVSGMGVAPPTGEDTLKRELRAEDTIKRELQILAVMTDQVHGVLLREPRGANGFGYDPLFYFPQFGQTTAELDMTTKGQISHRGKALRKMIAWMREHEWELGD
jgi:XTP/dITP diphosphohydrolase